MAEDIFEKILNLFETYNPDVVPAFPVLFKRDLNPEEDAARREFLLAIATNFKRDPAVLKANFKIESMGEVELNKENYVDQHIYFFWKYLTEKAYPVVKKLKNYTNNKIFGFALGFPINETRVVVLAEDPSPKDDVVSLECAFHGTVCPSTKALINYVEIEMDLANKFAEHFNLAGPNENPFTNGLSLAGRIGDANLQAWIDQRILLVNKMLTEKDKVWMHFTKFLFSYLNNHGDRIVFILMGRVQSMGWITKQIENIHGDNGHKVIQVEHPNAVNYPRGEYWADTNTYKKKLPFLKAAYHKFLKTGEIIDWLAIANYGEAEDTRVERCERFRSLYEKMKETNVDEIDNMDLRVALGIIKD